MHAHHHAPRLYGVYLGLSGTAATPAGLQLSRELSIFYARCAGDPLLQNAHSMRFGGGVHLRLADFRPEPEPESLVCLRGSLQDMADAVRDGLESGRHWTVPRAAATVKVEGADGARPPIVRVTLGSGGGALELLSSRLAESIFPHRGGDLGVNESPFAANLVRGSKHAYFPPSGPMELSHFVAAAEETPMVGWTGVLMNVVWMWYESC